MECHQLLGGKVSVYKRPESRLWQCSTFLGGRLLRKSTKEDSLAHAKEIAEDWYLELRGKSRAGLLKGGKTFREVAKVFEREYEIITEGQRSPQHVERHKENLRIHLIPFLGSMIVTDITAGTVQDYRVDRIQNPKAVMPSGSRAWDEKRIRQWFASEEAMGKQLRRHRPPLRKTLENEIITLRQVMKTALRHGWLQYVPDFSMPYKTAGKVSHRAWFSPVEYRQLYEATRRRAKQPMRECWRWHCEQQHDYVLFAANTGLRPDEIANLEFRDVTIVKDDATAETILEIEVRGKRGVGHCKSTAGAVRPFIRLRKRNMKVRTDRLFPGNHRRLFNTILDELQLKFDRDGKRRTAYSLRHTYICLRLMEGADIYQIAKNCRTSVEMIEKHYAVHLKSTLDAAAINVRKQRPPARQRKAILAEVV